jgi:hypothetical protein
MLQVEFTSFVLSVQKRTTHTPSVFSSVVREDVNDHARRKSRLSGSPRSKPLTSSRSLPSFCAISMCLCSLNVIGSFEHAIRNRQERSLPRASKQVCCSKNLPSQRHLGNLADQLRKAKAATVQIATHPRTALTQLLSVCCCVRKPRRPETFLPCG